VNAGWRWFHENEHAARSASDSEEGTAPATCDVACSVVGTIGTTVVAICEQIHGAEVGPASSIGGVGGSHGFVAIEPVAASTL
jgi:hypothetical protein